MDPGSEAGMTSCFVIPARRALCGGERSGEPLAPARFAKQNGAEGTKRWGETLGIHISIRKLTND
jgi:hypothetical protein